MQSNIIWIIIMLQKTFATKSFLFITIRKICAINSEQTLKICSMWALKTKLKVHTL